MTSFQSKIYKTHSGDFSIIEAETSERVKIDRHITPYLFLTNYFSNGKYQVNRRRVELQEGAFYFLNEGDELGIDFGDELFRKTVILQFCDLFIHNAYGARSSSDKWLLDHPEDQMESMPPIPSIPFAFSRKAQELLRYLLSADGDLQREEMVYAILSECMQIQKTSLNQLERVEAKKTSTREEIYRRCFFVKQYMRENFTHSPSLDQLGEIACMNKYHFLTNFVSLFGITPHQYIIRLKLEKAYELLVSGSDSVSEVCFAIGFESLPSFSKLFKSRYGLAPSKVLTARS